MENSRRKNSWRGTLENNLSVWQDDLMCMAWKATIISKGRVLGKQKKAKNII